MIGDVNGDGLDDIAVSAVNVDGVDAEGMTVANVGAVYILFGRESGFDDLYIGELDTADKLAAKGIVAIYGSAATTKYLGYALEAAGDVDGDGLADLLIGTNGTRDAFVVLGKALSKFDAAPDTVGTKASGAKVNIEGTASRGEFLQGSAAANVISMIGSADVAYAGAGNDTLSITSDNFKRAYGGAGTDTLSFNGADLVLDLSKHGRATALVDSIEIIDLTGSGDNALILDKHGLFQSSDARADGKTVLKN